MQLPGVRRSHSAFRSIGSVHRASRNRFLRRFRTVFSFFLSFFLLHPFHVQGIEEAAQQESTDRVPLGEENKKQIPSLKKIAIRNSVNSVKTSSRKSAHKQRHTITQKKTKRNRLIETSKTKEDAKNKISTKSRRRRKIRRRRSGGDGGVEKRKTRKRRSEKKGKKGK